MTQATSTTIDRPTMGLTLPPRATPLATSYGKLFPVGRSTSIPIHSTGGYGRASMTAGCGRDRAGPVGHQDRLVRVHRDDRTSTDSLRKVKAAGGTVVAPPFDVGDQGRMAASRIRPVPSCRSGRAPGWVASRRPVTTATAGPS